MDQLAKILTVIAIVTGKIVWKICTHNRTERLLLHNFTTAIILVIKNYTRLLMCVFFHTQVFTVAVAYKRNDYA